MVITPNNNHIIYYILYFPYLPVPCDIDKINFKCYFYHKHNKYCCIVMKSSTNKKHFSYLISIFYVLFSLLPVWSNGNIVLCYSAEGHLDIEVKTAQSCSARNSMRQVSQCENSRPCFCVDIPISKNKTDNTLCVAKVIAKKSSVRYSYFHTPPATHTPSLNTVTPFSLHPVINNSSHETLRTTILLI